jgi:hypothetical protein
VSAPSGNCFFAADVVAIIEVVGPARAGLDAVQVVAVVPLVCLSYRIVLFVLSGISNTRQIHGGRNI